MTESLRPDGAEGAFGVRPGGPAVGAARLLFGRRGLVAAGHRLVGGAVVAAGGLIDAPARLGGGVRAAGAVDPAAVVGVHQGISSGERLARALEEFPANRVPKAAACGFARGAPRCASRLTRGNALPARYSNPVPTARTPRTPP